MRRRSTRWALVVIATAAFLLASLVVARWLSVEPAERDAVEQLLRAQARGDARALIDQIEGCAADVGCVSIQRRNAQRLRSAGALQVISYASDTARVLGDAAGTARVVWKTPRRLTVVQCVGVRRTGGILRRPRIALTTLGPSIRRTGAC